jgi:hypothetical protein
MASYWDRTDERRRLIRERSLGLRARQLEMWGWSDERLRDGMGRLLRDRPSERRREPRRTHAGNPKRPGQGRKRGPEGRIESTRKRDPRVILTATGTAATCEICGKPNATVAYFATGMTEVAYRHHECDRPKP